MASKGDQPQREELEIVVQHKPTWKKYAKYGCVALVVLIIVLVVMAAVGRKLGFGGMQTSGESTSSICSVTSGDCSMDGSSNFHKVSLTYSNGTFSGTITTNQCMDKPYGKVNGSVLSEHAHTASCVQQTFPAPKYASGQASAAPLRGRVGLTIQGGVNIYGPLEAGFNAGQVCDSGTCPSGVDVPICQAKMLFECQGESFKWDMMLDDCGGHAAPYHYHKDLACDYNSTYNVTHSPLLGIALDGKGIYGQWEGNYQAPQDLDACNGHFGPVPAYSDGTVSFPAATNVYHYHVTTEAPFTVGCFGPVDSVQSCKNLYPDTCGSGFEDFCTDKGFIHYDSDCPCYQQDGVTYNSNYTAMERSSCPNKSAFAFSSSFLSQTLFFFVILSVMLFSM